MRIERIGGKAGLCGLLLLAGMLAGCAASQVAAGDPVGKRFPSVTGRALAGTDYRIPEDFAGAPAILLVGYVMDAQFDLDRWLLGLQQLGTPVRYAEVPTIQGMAPGLFAALIDQGMRRGIPKEDWSGVITVYGDANPIVELTGRQNPRNARVLLLDADGVVRWFHDRGYSSAMVAELDRLARGLKGAAQ